MNAQTAKKRAILLFVVWCISCLAITLFNMYIQLFEAEISFLKQEETSIILVLLVTALYILPMLLLIHRQAMKASLGWLVVVSRVFLFLFGIAWTIFLVGYLGQMLVL